MDRPLKVKEDRSLALLRLRLAGIVKHIAWHAFRHSFATMLKANGEDAKVVPESLRHANSRITLMCTCKT